ncbi:MAG: hypothetical protein U0W65_14795 [Bacteroidia bacterium]
MKRNFINVEVSEDEKIDILIEARKKHKISVSDYVRQKLFTPEHETIDTNQEEILIAQNDKLKSEIAELEATSESNAKRLEEIAQSSKERLKDALNEKNELFNDFKKIKNENKRLQDENMRLQNEISNLKALELKDEHILSDNERTGFLRKRR